MDDVVNRFAKELADAIAAAVAENPQVEACRAKAREAGFDMRVTLPGHVDAEDVQAEYRGLRTELAAYSPELARTPFFVALTKMDLLGPDVPLPALEAEGALGVFGVSAVTNRGLPELVEALWDATQSARVRESAPAEGEGSDEDEEWWTP